MIKCIDVDEIQVPQNPFQEKVNDNLPLANEVTAPSNDSQITTSPPPTIPAVTPKSSNKLLIIGFLLLILVALVGGVYIYLHNLKLKSKITTSQLTPPQVSTEDKDPSANWGTFNSKYNYRIKYPKNWDIKTEDWSENGDRYGLLEDDEVILRLREEAQNAPVDTNSVNISLKIPQNINNLPLEDWVRNYFESNDYPATITSAEIQISGTKSIIASRDDFPLIKAIFIPNEENVYIITVNPYNDQYKTVVNQILSTFQFLENETANWKSYTSNKFGFSIKYPPEWKYLETPTSTYETETDQVWFTSTEFPPPQTDARPDITFIFTKQNPSSNWDQKYFNDYKSEEYYLGNITGTKITGINKVGLERDTIIIAKAGDSYIQILKIDSDGAIKYSDQILSTFMFTN